jgi:hypothetical protein
MSQELVKELVDNMYRGDFWILLGLLGPLVVFCLIKGTFTIYKILVYIFYSIALRKENKRRVQKGLPKLKFHLKFMKLKASNKHYWEDQDEDEVWK